VEDLVDIRGGIAHDEASEGRSSDPIRSMASSSYSIENTPATTSRLVCLSSSHAIKSKVFPSSSHHARDSHAHSIQSTPVSPPSSCAGRDDWHSRRIHMRN
jgi:hypothetical protein